MSIKIEKRRIQSMGDYHFVSIPKALIDHNILSTEKEYTIIFNEVKKEKSSKDKSSVQEDN